MEDFVRSVSAWLVSTDSFTPVLLLLLLRSSVNYGNPLE